MTTLESYVRERHPDDRVLSVYLNSSPIPFGPVWSRLSETALEIAELLRDEGASIYEVSTEIPVSFEPYTVFVARKPHQSTRDDRPRLVDSIDRRAVLSTPYHLVCYPVDPSPEVYEPPYVDVTIDDDGTFETGTVVTRAEHCYDAIDLQSLDGIVDRPQR